MPRHRTEATKSPPRIMVEVTPRQFNIFKKHLPYGFQKQIFSAIVEDLTRMWEEFGDEFTRAMLAKNLTYRQFMDDYMERTHGHTKGPQEAQLPRDDFGGEDGFYQEHKGIEEDEQGNC